MLKKLILLFLFLNVTAILKAQESDLILGTWVFKGVYHKEKIEAKSLKTLKNQVINKLTFTFRNDGTFSSYIMGENLSGTWSRENNPNRVLLFTKYENYEFRILDLTGDKLALKIGLGEFWMARRIQN